MNTLVQLTMLDDRRVVLRRDAVLGVLDNTDRYGKVGAAIYLANGHRVEVKQTIEQIAKELTWVLA